MRKKVKIKFLKDKPEFILINVRDKELINIMNRSHSYVYKNKKKYTRKRKHKNKIEEQ